MLPMMALNVGVTASIATACVLVADPTAQSRGPSAPPVPFEDPGACPFEGCVYHDGWVANGGVDIRTDRQLNAPVGTK